MKISISGPRSVGKTTVTKLVSKKLGLKYFSSDEIAENYLKDKGGLDKATKSGEIAEFIRNKAYDLIKEVYEKDDFVFDIAGGSIGSRKFSEVSTKIREIAKNNSIVIGLLPSEDEEESIKILFEREKNRKHFKDMDREELYKKVKKSYSKFPSMFREISDFIIYTKDKTPEEISNEIVYKISKLK